MMEKTTELTPGNRVLMLMSKVVEQVRGMAISGPTQMMAMPVRISAVRLPR